MKKIPFFLLFSLAFFNGFAQSYHALHGNLYGSGLTVYNNPASIVHQPFPWDLTVFSTQQKMWNDVATVRDYSLLGTPKNSYLAMDEGLYGRTLHYQSDIRLFNLRFNIGRNSAVAAGANLRTYMHLNTSPYYFSDTIVNTPEFFRANGNGAVPIWVNGTQSSWGELFFSYARTLYENELVRISGGATLKLQRGLSGGYVRVRNGYYESRNDGEGRYSVVTNGSGRYGYSSNYDRINSDNEGFQNVKDFMGHSLNGASGDIGAEMILRYDGYAVSDNAPPYNMKIGFSILDIGRNQYRHGLESRRFTGFENEVRDSALQLAFQSVGSVAEFNDSLETLTNGLRRTSGIFPINQPMRIVVNVDKHLNGFFFVNANLSANLRSSSQLEKLSVRELDLLAVTPRWEKRKYAAYLPIQYTTEGNLWIGMAGKIGPVALGLHNAGWIFSKKAMPNGGFFLALTFRGWKFKNGDGVVECPEL